MWCLYPQHAVWSTPLGNLWQIWAMFFTQHESHNLTSFAQALILTMGGCWKMTKLLFFGFLVVVRIFIRNYYLISPSDFDYWTFGSWSLDGICSRQTGAHLQYYRSGDGGSKRYIWAGRGGSLWNIWSQGRSSALLPHFKSLWCKNIDISYFTCLPRIWGSEEQSTLQALCI